MSAINNGGPAFPRSGSDFSSGRQDGMTLRDYFAAAALAGRVYARDELDDCLPAGELYRLAVDAYALADAMLAARAKGAPTP